MGPEALAAELEIVGIGLNRPPARLGLEHLIFHAEFFGIGNRFLLAVEAERHLCIRVARTRPAHQWLDLTRAARLEVKQPLPGLCLAGLHGRLGGFVDTGACQFHPLDAASPKPGDTVVKLYSYRPKRDEFASDNKSIAGAEPNPKKSF